jgi:hypothetical protein
MTAQEYYATMQQGNQNPAMSQQAAAPAPSPGPTGIAFPTTKEEFDALPNGTFYFEPDTSQIFQKGNKTRPLPPQPSRGVEA